MTRAFAAVLLVLLAQSAFAQELGRLFFTPEQRAALDARRKARLPDKPAAPLVVSPTTRLDGYVKRSDGRSTVWMNGEPQTEGSADAPRIGGDSSERLAVPTGEGGRRAGMKPGEVLDRGTGEVRSPLGDGEIRVRRAP